MKAQETPKPPYYDMESEEYEIAFDITKEVFTFRIIEEQEEVNDIIIITIYQGGRDVFFEYIRNSGISDGIFKSANDLIEQVYSAYSEEERKVLKNMILASLINISEYMTYEYLEYLLGNDYKEFYSWLFSSARKSKYNFRITAKNYHVIRENE